MVPSFRPRNQLNPLFAKTKGPCNTVLLCGRVSILSQYEDLNNAPCSLHSELHQASSSLCPFLLVTDLSSLRKYKQKSSFSSQPCFRWTGTLVHLNLARDRIIRVILIQKRIPKGPIASREITARLPPLRNHRTSPLLSQLTSSFLRKGEVNGRWVS